VRIEWREILQVPAKITAAAALFYFNASPMQYNSVTDSKVPVALEDDLHRYPA
jgi:hypothetical protein